MVATTVLGFLLASALPQSGHVSGTVAYREKIALTDDAVVVVQLDRFSPEGHVNVSEVRMKTGGKQVPIDFNLPYAFEHAPEGSTYGLRAEIWMGGQRRFESPSHSMVALGSESKVAMLVQGVEPNDLGKFDGFLWMLRELDGKPVAMEKGRPSLKFEPEGKIAGHGGINRFGGTYAYSAPGVQIDPGAMTLMAGDPERMELESGFVRLLPLVNRLTVEEGQLMLWRGEKLLVVFSKA